MNDKRDVHSNNLATAPASIDEVIDRARRRAEESKRRQSQYEPFVRDIVTLLNNGALWADILYFLNGRLTKNGEIISVTARSHANGLKTYVRAHIEEWDREFCTTESDKARRRVNLLSKRQMPTGQANVARAPLDVDGHRSRKLAPVRQNPFMAGSVKTEAPPSPASTQLRSAPADEDRERILQRVRAADTSAKDALAEELKKTEY